MQKEPTAMDLLIEILLDVYGELIFLIVPEKRTNKKYIIITKIIAILVFIGVAALTLWGAFLITECDNLIGILPISIAALISLIQVILGIILFKKRR